MAGEDGEASARYWIGWSGFLFELAGGTGLTKVGNMPLRQLPGATRQSLQRAFITLSGLPKGISAASFKQMTQLIFSKAGHISDDIAVHGSRVSGSATAASGRSENSIAIFRRGFSVKDGGWGFKLEAGAGSVVE